MIVYTGAELSRKEEAELREYADAIIIKDASSPERLLDETSLHLHRLEARLPADKRRMLERLRNSDAVFQGKKMLLVDDDVRNVFALASLLESRGMEILFAENGKDGIQTLREHPDVDLVLMDIMMPEMDGHEATRRIRDMEEFKQLPDRRPHRQGDEGRPREEPRGGGVGLHREAGGHRQASLADAGLAARVR